MMRFIWTVAVPAIQQAANGVAQACGVKCKPKAATEMRAAAPVVRPMGAGE